MDSLHKKVLARERVYLMDNLKDVHAINDHLFSNSIITMEQKLDIEDCEKSSQRKRSLLDLIPTRGEHAFDALMNAFGETEYRYICDKINQTLNEQRPVQNCVDLRAVNRVQSLKERSPTNRNKIPVVREHVETAAKQIDDWIYDELPRNVRQRLVTESELLEVAESVSAVTSLQTVGEKMGFTGADIERYGSCSPFYTPMQFKQMFSAWRQREGLDATIEALIKILRQASVDDECYKSIFCKSSSNVTQPKQIY